MTTSAGGDSHKVELHIGIDDTDSPLGGCTTYTGTSIFQELTRYGFEPLDYPWLVRLNPNIPWKTRGNGAVSLHFTVSKNHLNHVKEQVISIVKKQSDINQPKTDPAIVFLEGHVSNNLQVFSQHALSEVLTIQNAHLLSRKIGAEVHLLKGSRGIIGALAAIGMPLGQEETFEIIAYRNQKNYGKPRQVSSESVIQMDTMYGNVTFNNLDPETGRILITPHGPDPVLFGIRGENVDSLEKAAKMVVANETIETYQVFRTNSGTGIHLETLTDIGTLTRYRSAVVDGIVENIPWRARGGHVFFDITDDTGSITCAAFRPTGKFRNIMLQLLPGDTVRAGGGVKDVRGHGLTLNLEKLQVMKLVEVTNWSNPSCTICRAKCESEGRNQGYRCRKCSAHYSHTMKIPERHTRRVMQRIYMPPPRAHRHLTKPESRQRASQTWNFSGCPQLTEAISV